MAFKSAIGYRGIGYFLILSTLILIVAGLSMLFPETFWKQAWFFKKTEYQQMLSWRILAGWGFWSLATIMASAATGWFRRQHWGWSLTVAIFVINGVTDAAQLVTGNYVEGAIGVCVTAGIIFYLTRHSVKAIFH